MNRIDVALLVLLLFCAVRGFWRGLFRESFGFLGLIAGLAAALRLSEVGSVALAARLPGWDALPETARLGIAFVFLFLAVHAFFNLFGVLLDRVFRSLTVRRISHAAGAMFAVAKGGAVLAFVLLFLHLFPVVPGLDERIMESRLARPLLSAASSVIRAGLREAPGAERGARV
jgi:membrane protein required for colicin V production